jgi:hypothetical protein
VTLFLQGKRLPHRWQQVSWEPGGLFGGVTKRVVGDEFRIVQLDVSEQGSAFCGGLKGKGGQKMCIGVGWEVGIHKTIKADLSAVVGKTLFMLVTQPGEDETKGVVHCLEPSFPSRVMGGLLTRYLEEGCTLDGGDTLFRGLQVASEQEDFSAGTLASLTKRVDGRGEQELYSAAPYKNSWNVNDGKVHRREGECSFSHQILRRDVSSLF